MHGFRFYQQLKTYLQSGMYDSSCTKVDRWSIRRSANNFILKDDRLFYTGPKDNFMRLVVMDGDEMREVLQECHNQNGNGNHSGVRRTIDRVVAGYYWHSIKQDVADWVRGCISCQLNNSLKTVTRTNHPIKVDENWSVVAMDLIGPLKETARNNQYILMITDLFSNFVVAEPLGSKSAVEVSAALVSKFYLYGIVDKIIFDQGGTFVNELNKEIFTLLNIKQAVSSTCNYQINEEDKLIHQNTKCAIERFANEHHNDWDLHLQAVVYGINTVEQSHLRKSPFSLFFHRRHSLPKVLKTCPMGDKAEIGDQEEPLEARIRSITELNEKVLGNIERAQQQLKNNSFPSHKRNSDSIIKEDDVLLSEDLKRQKMTPGLMSLHKSPCSVINLPDKGVVTVEKESWTMPTVDSNSLRIEPPDIQTYKLMGSFEMEDHSYALTGQKDDHPYPLSTQKSLDNFDPLKDDLTNHTLHESWTMDEQNGS